MSPANTRLFDAGWIAPEVHKTQRLHALRLDLDGTLAVWTRWVGPAADVYALGRCLAKVAAHPALAAAPQGSAAAWARGALERAVAGATREGWAERPRADALKRLLEGVLQRYQKRAARGD